ncbi:MAG TPA: hypothetical protein PKD83_10515, partial [Ignavibacteria bacterium]|nr:hypothetical protein [Ignavibacteria bacterium]
MLKLNNNLNKSNFNTESTASDSAKTTGSYIPGKGLKLVDTDKGSVSFGVFSYIRYLNQKGLDSTYTNSFGKTSSIKRRQDVQLNKVNIKFFGWIMDPDFRYLFYVWTSNTSLGQVSQVVVAGNLQYGIDKHINIGAGINSLPGVFSTSGNFPYWLPVDNRLIADEFFRPSYTTGIWANGRITDNLDYNVMAGNNLSQFGVDAGQLDNGLRTFSGVINWYPTTGEFGKYSSFGDFDYHKKPATLLAGHFTYSEENKESQPNSDQFENVQLRLSDGSIIFTSDLFGPGITINDAVYKMTCANLGFKYKGFAFVGEYYWRWLTNFTGLGIDSLGFKEITDNGFQANASYMILQQKLQVYATLSQVFGDYGNPWDARVGFNYYPWKNQAFRMNVEYIQVYRSPV